MKITDIVVKFVLHIMYKVFYVVDIELCCYFCSSVIYIWY